MNTFESRPDADIDITVRTQPNSYVGLLAIDQNAAHLRSGYDLTQNVVSEELKRYDVSNMSPYYTIMKDSKSHFFWKPGSSNSYDIFYVSNTMR